MENRGDSIKNFFNKKFYLIILIIIIFLVIAGIANYKPKENIDYSNYHNVSLNAFENRKDMEADYSKPISLNCIYGYINNSYFINLGEFKIPKTDNKINFTSNIYIPTSQLTRFYCNNEEHYTTMGTDLAYGINKSSNFNLTTHSPRIGKLTINKEANNNLEDINLTIKSDAMFFGVTICIDTNANTITSDYKETGTPNRLSKKYRCFNPETTIYYETKKFKFDFNNFLGYTEKRYANFLIIDSERELLTDIWQYTYEISRFPKYESKIYDWNKKGYLPRFLFSLTYKDAGAKDYYIPIKR